MFKFHFVFNTFLILGAISLSVVSCQSQSQSSTVASASSYKAENEGWLVNLDEAYEKSKKTGKPIMANFTGSDWCGWCKRLTASVFSQDEFKKWAAKM
ncbi:MAG: thioredoxin family protein [Saprospiraceae bacterium]|nr:thioredoxin family protein [Saprospiraceae bacterium]